LIALLHAGHVATDNPVLVAAAGLCVLIGLALLFWPVAGAGRRHR
jgi:hypothetical protein